MDRKDGESYLEYIKRITNKCEDKQITYSEWGDYILGAENVYSNDNCRKAFYIVNKLMDKIDLTCEITDDKVFKELEVLKREVTKERMKFQTEKLEYNRWLREEARDELIYEKLAESLERTIPLEIPQRLELKSNSKSYALCYGDAHDGTEFSIKGLFGETIAEYSPEIFEERMWKLLNRVKQIVEKENIENLKIFDFSDSIDGLLRVNQLSKLRWGVVDQTIHYANFISNWLKEFTKFVNVEFQMVIDGNHSQLRMLGQQKNTFKDDNMSKFIAFTIRGKLENNPNFKFIENPTGMIFDTIENYNLLGIHGEVKSMERALDSFSSIYKVDINYLLAGHLHHNKQEEVGFDAEVINIGSIIGVDDYSLSLMKASNSSAKLIGFEDGLGKIVEYTIKLN